MNRLTDNEEQSLQAIEAELMKAKSEFDRVRRLYDDTIRTVHLRQHGVKPGSEIACQGKYFLVTDVRPNVEYARIGIKPYIYCRLRKKDGTLTDRITSIGCQWEPVEEAK